MTVDYDLVVVGDTREGREGALRAARMGARVAWVMPELAGDRALTPADLTRQMGLLWAGRWRSQAVQAVSLGLFDGAPAGNGWQAGAQWAALVAKTVDEPSAESLMAEGVDVIAAHGTFEAAPSLTIVAGQRRLTTRSVLVAVGEVPTVPDIPGLATVPYLTPNTLAQQDTLPDSLIVLGSTPTALELSQALAQWGVEVTLVTAAPQLLPREDPAVSAWMGAQLLADGVKVALGQRITSVAVQGAGVQLRTGAEATIAAEALLLAQPPAPALAHLNLEAVGIAGDRGLPVNAFLQTQHPRIYGCGAALGGYALPAIARHEAQIAVENALFWPRRRVNYHTLPYALFTQPEMGRVGLTEPQARTRYGKAVRTYTTSWYGNAKAHWRDATTGFCKLVVHRKGTILGAHIVGSDASELIQSIAWAMAQGIRINAIATLPTLPETLTDILHQTAEKSWRDRWQIGHWRRDWAENWCNWRRNG